MKIRSLAGTALPTLFLIGCISLPSCSPDFSPEIDEALSMAGGNRRELEKVLRHYEKDPADSLKFRAAEFLIVGMSGKYSSFHDAPWNDVATARLRWTSSPDKELIINTYELGEPVLEKDLEHVTADFLIDNIDLAFMVWQKRAWGKHIPFDVFCEDILPYRIGTEPLENWREKVLASFAGLEAELSRPDMTAVEACKLVNEVLPTFRVDKDFPDMSYSQAMASTRGGCDKMAAFAALVMRGLGIPVTVDYTTVYTGRTLGHTWNAVRDSTGAYISFLGTETQPGESHQALEFILSKIYRRTFANQKEVTGTPVEDIPPLLRDVSSIDASSYYDGYFDVRVPLTVRAPDNSARVYLAVVGDGLNQNIVAEGRVEGEYGVFKATGESTGYFPVYYKDNVPIPAGEPFLLDSIGNVHPVIPGPFRGPHILSAGKPCTIPLSNFDIGGEGVAFHEIGEQNDGFSPMYRISGGDPFSVPVDIHLPDHNLGSFVAGEWLNYTVEVETSGTYLCRLSVSGYGNARFHLKVDGENRTGSVEVPANGSWYDWQWQPAQPLQLELTKGTHVVQFYAEGIDFNAKEMKFTFLKQ